MGLLDDAIREHLELKRRRGADPSEVSQQEQEALGPVRRDLAPEPGEELVDLPPGEEPVAYDERPGAAADPPAFADEDAPYEDAAPPEGVYDAAADFEDGPPTEYIAPPATEGAPPGGRSDEWGFDDDEESAAEEPAPEQTDEDVLEETPEFLQESPEHDRLWFEQKPPRDFDFDG
jgi:hypothetical protein